MEVILTNEKEIFLIRGNGGFRFPRAGEVSYTPVGETFHYGADGADDEAVSAAVADAAVADGLTGAWVGLRETFAEAGGEIYRRAGKAAELHYWDKSSRYCPACGAETGRGGEIMKKCTGCGREFFPQVSPAIIVLVRRGEEALLVHARNFSRPFFGLVAGFVETGESLEECVVREVREETGLEIRDVRYFGSQPWPFPSQLMVGFTAEYVSGDVRFADRELTAGGFFTKENLPLIPGPPSIARRLIDAWLNEP